LSRAQNDVYNNLFIIKSLKELINGQKIRLSFPDWGDNRDRFKKEVAQLCPDGLIEYFSFKPRDEYISFLGKFDIYLSAARSDSSPASLIEAMAAGLYPVAADIPGVREWLDVNNGILYHPDDERALYDAISTLIEKHDNIGEVLTKNNERVRRSGLFSENIRATIKIMEHLISRGR